MTKTIVLALALTASTLACQAQARYNHKQMQTERIGRGVVAFRSGKKVVVSWRTLPGDKRHEAFNVYRNGVRLDIDRVNREIPNSERYAVYGVSDFIGTAVLMPEERLLRVEKNFF